MLSCRKLLWFDLANCSPGSVKDFEGNRDMSLAFDSGFFVMDAVELHLKENRLI